MILQVQGPPAPPPPPPFDPSTFDPNLIFQTDGDMSAPVFVFTVIAVLLTTTIILWPLVRAFARRLEGKGNADPALRSEVEHLHARLEEVDSLQARVLELEERVDFAERLLAQAQQPARLGVPAEESGR
jgi:hypothetical protein